MTHASVFSGIGGPEVALPLEEKNLVQYVTQKNGLSLLLMRMGCLRQGKRHWLMSNN